MPRRRHLQRSLIASHVRTQRLLVVLVLNLALVAGLAWHGRDGAFSSACAAGGDYLLDAAEGVALLAIRLSARHAGNGPRRAANASSVAALHQQRLAARPLQAPPQPVQAHHRHHPMDRLACRPRASGIAGNGWRRTRPPKGR